MILNDLSITRSVDSGEIKISPFDPKRIQPASYDLTLWDTLLIPSYLSLTDAMPWSPGIRPYVDPGAGFFDPFVMTEWVTDWELRPGAQPLYRKASMPGNEAFLPEGTTYGYWLAPGEFLLGATREVIGIPGFMSAQLNGKSTLGRWGITVHVTAGFIDPGFNGRITLEIKNEGPFTILLTPGMPVAQVLFYTLTGSAIKPYNGHYQGDKDAAPPRGAD